MNSIMWMQIQCRITNAGEPFLARYDKLTKSSVAGLLTTPCNLTIPPPSAILLPRK
jgi:hypothetical protein